MWLTYASAKIKKAWAEGRSIQLVTPSVDRVQPFCPHFGICGGCKWQMLPYPKQLEYKQQQAGDQLRRISGLSLPEILPIIGSAKDKWYRNKLEFTFSAQRYFTNEEIRAAGEAELPAEHGFWLSRAGAFR